MYFFFLTDRDSHPPEDISRRKFVNLTIILRNFEPSALEKGNATSIY